MKGFKTMKIGRSYFFAKNSILLKNKLLNGNMKLGFFLLCSLIVYEISFSRIGVPTVLGASTSNLDEIALNQSDTPVVSTITSFEEKEEVSEESISYKTVYINDPDMEIGEESTEEEGRDGKLVRTYKVTYWYGEETARELLDTKEDSPQDEIVHVGTKVIWRSIGTLGEKNVDDDELSYWRKISHVWATSYDKSCFGCNEYTAVGAKLDYGVCAVDRTVIKLYTTIYVPGYGICKALDVGGGIVGNKIDVGFYDLHAQAPEVGWTGSHFTDIYLLDNEEANLTLLQ